MIEKRQLEKVSVTRLAGLCRVIAANAAKKQGSRRTGTPTRVGMGSASTNRAHVQGVARTSLEDKGIGHQNGGIAVQYLNLSSPPESHTTTSVYGCTRSPAAAACGTHSGHKIRKQGALPRENPALISVTSWQPRKYCISQKISITQKSYCHYNFSCRRAKHVLKARI